MVDGEWLTAKILPVRDAPVRALGEQCAAMQTHSSKQASASSARDSAGAEVRADFFLVLEPPPTAPEPLLAFPLLPLESLAFIAAAEALASPELFPSASFFVGGFSGTNGGGDIAKGEKRTRRKSGDYRRLRPQGGLQKMEPKKIAGSKQAALQPNI